MANLDVKNRTGVTDKRKGLGTTTTPLSAIDANLRDVGSMRTRLAAARPALYTSAMLDTMTHNDMVYAIRQIDDPAGI
jgi:hypothetical protein